MKVMRSFIPVPAVIALVILIPRPLGATDTRVETLGASGLFLEDDNNIWYYPTTLLRYPNLLILSLGGKTSALTPPSELRTSGTFKLTRGMVLGVAFGSEETKETYAPLSAEEQLHLFWGAPIGGRRFGLRFSRFGAIQNAVPSYERSVSITRFQAGFEPDLDEGKVLESAFHFYSIDFTDIRNGEKNSEPTGYWELGLRIRYNVKPKDNIRIVPVLTVTKGVRGVRFFSSGQESATQKEEYLAARIGVAFEIHPRDDLLFIYHTSISYNRTLTKSSTDQSKPEVIIWEVPLAGIGVEKWIRPWLAFRTGAVLRLSLDENEGEGNTQRQMHTSTVQTLGLALSIEGLQVDFAIEPEILKKGPYFMSGTKAPLFTRVTLRYNF